MTMSVLKGQFSFPLTSYTKERKVSISGAHGENRTERTECYACLLRPFNVTLKHDLPSCIYIPPRYHTLCTDMLLLYNKTVTSELLQYVLKTVCFVRGGGIDPRTL